jgi:uracil-DNA glycosylase
VRIVVGLGRIGFSAALRSYRDAGRLRWDRTPRFAHGAQYVFGGLTFLASYHPSQQNTFTGKLTEEMLDEIFRNSRDIISREGEW